MTSRASGTTGSNSGATTQSSSSRTQAIAGRFDYTLETGVAVGPAAEVIIEAVETHGPGHIVVGTHGRSHVEESVLGDVAESLVRRSPHPVTTVR